VRVLLADDDAAFCEQLAATLRDRMPEVDIVAYAGDGHAAVAAAMAATPQVVFIDYSMPGPNGGHAASVIKQALPETRVVILTGLDRAELEDVGDGVDVVRKGAGMEDALLAVLAQSQR
jgi:DNA-binding NarL/FixJ family response regulator